MGEKVDPRITLLLEDYRHFGESLWRNDEIGEKRFSFFVTVATAVIGGLVTLYQGGAKVPGCNLLGIDMGTLRIMQGATAALLVLGLLTYCRMLQKNRVTHEYHFILDYIRNELRALGHAPDAYSIKDQTKEAAKKKKGVGPFRAGLGEASGVLCGMLSFLLVVLFTDASSVAVGAAAVAGILISVRLVYVAHRR